VVLVVGRVPSTHILKPAVHRLTQVPAAEAGSLALAREAGIEAPEAEARTFLGQPTYIVERFDRDTRAGGIRRVHTEDFAQAHGRPPEMKYGMTARQVLELVDKHSNDEEKYTFVRMLAFNTAIGNADAHAKNYSVFLDDGVRMAPLYDSIPTMVWPEFTEDRLAMKIGGARRPQEVTVDNWRKFARTSGLDEERVASIAMSVAQTVRDRAHDVYSAAGFDTTMLDHVDALIQSTTRHLATKSSSESSSAARSAAAPSAACSVCGRPLTSPESIARGVGPGCAKEG
jgi:serine/threonine-protein kinase HipA